MSSNFHLQEAISAYYSVYEQNVQEDLLWEALLTEEFLSEAYQTVADYLVYNNFVPGYQTAEVYMAEMALEDIDSILFETGVLNEQYLMEAGFFQNLGAGADKLVNRAGSAVRGAAQTVRGTAQRAGQAVARTGQAALGTAQRAGQAVAGGVQRAGQAAVRTGQAAVGSAVRAGQAVAGGVQRAGQAVTRAVTPVAQAVQGTAQRAVAAGTSALQGAGRAVAGAGQAALGTAQRAGQAVAGGVQRAGQAVAGAGQAALGTAQRAGQAVAGGVAAAGRRIGQEVEISRRVGAGEPISGAANPKPQAPKPQSTGVSGLSAADRAAYSAGGGNAAAQKGMGQTTSQVIAQGKTNLGRMNQGAPAPAGAKPTSGPSSTNPKTGLSAYPASKSTNSAPAPQRPTAPISPTKPGRTFLDGSRSSTAPAQRSTAPAPAAPAAAPKLSKMQQDAKDLRDMKTASQQRQASMLKQSFDVFDVVIGHLIDEGYAENEEQALVIMANMSEEWRQSILSEDPIQDYRDMKRARENASGMRGPELSHSSKGTPKPGSATITKQPRSREFSHGGSTPRGREFTNPPS